MNRIPVPSQVREPTDDELRGIVPVGPTEPVTQIGFLKLDTLITALDDLEAYSQSQSRGGDEGQPPHLSKSKPPKKSKESGDDHASEIAKATEREKKKGKKEKKKEEKERKKKRKKERKNRKEEERERKKEKKEKSKADNVVAEEEIQEDDVEVVRENAKTVKGPTKDKENTTVHVEVALPEEGVGVKATSASTGKKVAEKGKKKQKSIGGVERELQVGVSPMTSEMVISRKGKKGTSEKQKAAIEVKSPQDNTVASMELDEEEAMDWADAIPEHAAPAMTTTSAQSREGPEQLPLQTTNHKKRPLEDPESGPVEGKKRKKAKLTRKDRTKA